MSFRLATARTGGGFGDRTLGTPSTDSAPAAGGGSGDTALGTPSSCSIFLGFGATQHFSTAHTCPSAERPVRVASPAGDIGVLPLLPHQSPPAPLGTALRPEQRWHRGPAPARRGTERATMCHNGPIVPQSHRALSHPPRDCPTRSAPSRDPLLPSGDGGGGTVTVGTPGCAVTGRGVPLMVGDQRGDGDLAGWHQRGHEPGAQVCGRDPFPTLGWPQDCPQGHQAPSP